MQIASWELVLTRGSSQAAKGLPSGARMGVKGVGEDALTKLRLLDSFCYTNVFVDEGNPRLCKQSE